MSQDGLKWVLVALAILGITGYVSERFPGEGAGGRPEVRLSEAQFSAIMNELREIRRAQQEGTGEGKSAKAQAAGKNGDNEGTQSLSLDLPDRPMQGSPTAKLVMMEFTDYQCPFCARFHKETLPLLRKEFIDTGRLRYVLMDLPLSNIHPHAFLAAEAAHCAGEQGKFYELSDRLFQNSARLNPGVIEASAAEVGLDMARYSACLRDGRHKKTVKSSQDMAEQLGFSSTPTFVLGHLKDGRLEDGGYFLGAQPYSVFQGILQKVLEGR